MQLEEFGFITQPAFNGKRHALRNLVYCSLVTSFTTIRLQERQTDATVMR